MCIENFGATSFIHILFVGERFPRDFDLRYSVDKVHLEAVVFQHDRFFIFGKRQIGQAFQRLRYDTCTTFSPKCQAIQEVRGDLCPNFVCNLQKTCHFGNMGFIFVVAYVY